VISQLLYDWLEDDIEYVIDPNKINKLIEYDKFSQSLELLIQKTYVNINFMKKEHEVTMFILEEIKRQLTRTVEMETIVKIAQFFNMIFPNNQIDQEMYVHCIDKLSLNLMGYKFYDMHNKKHPTRIENIKNQVTSLSNIIQFLVLGMRIDFWESDFFLFPNNYYYSVQDQTPSSPISSNKIINLGNKSPYKYHPYVQTGKDAVLKAPFLPKKPRPRKIIKEGTTNINVSEVSQSESDNRLRNLKNLSDEKQEELFMKVYNKLSNYFDEKNKKIEHRKKSLLNQISDLVAISDNNLQSVVYNSKTPDKYNQKKESPNKKKERIQSCDCNKKSMKKTPSRKRVPLSEKNYVTLASELKNENISKRDSFINIPNNTNILNDKNPKLPILTTSILESGVGNVTAANLTSQKGINGIERKDLFVTRAVDSAAEIKSFNIKSKKTLSSNGVNDIKLERNPINVVGEKIEFDFNPNRVDNSLNYRIPENDFVYKK